MFHIKQKDKRKYFGDIFLSLLLILLMGGCYVVTTHVLWKMTLYDCYEEMEKATDAASASLYHFLEMDRENLELIAGVLAYERNGVKDRIKERLSAFSDHQYIDALCVQFKDGTLITDGGRLPDYSSLPSFDEMTDNLPYISGRFPGNEETETWFLYQAVPVSFEGGTQAVLYGFTDLKSFPERFSANLPYGGKSQLYLVDADTGDFLMDMWHDSLGNLYDGSMKTRKPMEGYDPDIMLNDIRSGRSGYYVFLSNTKNEYLYTRYQPAGINNWSIQLSVPEQVAFYKVGEMNGTIFVMGD